jgi:hypothetical protein
MPSEQFGRLAFFLGLMGLGSALAGWPKFMHGKRGTAETSVLVFAAIVVGTLHHVVPMSETTSVLTSVVSIAMTGTAIVRRLIRD